MAHRCPAVDTKAMPKKPNVVFMLSDDQNWNGLSVRMHPEMPDSMSSTCLTPNIAKLAAAGMRFSAAYAPSPVCSPTRYSLLTGKSTARHGMTKAAGVVRSHPGYEMLPPQIPRRIAADEVTTAMLLKRAGYATAHYGKWHLLGGGPGRFGFDEHDGETGNQDAAPFRDPNPVDIFGMGRRACAFMARNVKAVKPFYVHLSYHALHYPENARKATLDACAKRLKGRPQRNVQTAAITEDLDAGVGMVLDEIDRLGIADNTVVIYTADNGGGGRSGRPLTGGKGTLWEGGIRVPLIVRGPRVRAGAFCHVRVSGCDLLPTLCDLAGLAGPLPKGVDGGSIVPLLTGGGKGTVKRPREEMVFHFPHYQKGDIGPHSVIFLGRYKLLKLHETGQVRLFDIARDISERRDLSSDLPEKAAELDRRLGEYLKTVGARMARGNPDHDPSQKPPTEQRPRHNGKRDKSGRRGGKGGRR